MKELWLKLPARARLIIEGALHVFIAAFFTHLTEYFQGHGFNLTNYQAWLTAGLLSGGYAVWTWLRQSPLTKSLTTISPPSAPSEPPVCSEAASAHDAEGVK